MIKKAAVLYGVVFVLIGLLGFVPGITSTDSMGMPVLLGLFMVGTLHNIIHLASGAAALAMSGSEATAKRYFQIFGLVYVVVTIVGFLTPGANTAMGANMLGILPVNLADNLLHLALAATMTYLGFVAKPSVKAV